MLLTIGRNTVVAAFALISCSAGQALATPPGFINTYIVCADEIGESMTMLQEPTFCSTLQPNQSLEASIALHRLRWHHWGHSSATAVGRTKVKDFEPWYRVRVRAYRRVFTDCGDGGYVYTRLRVTTKYGRTVLKMLDCDT